MATLADIRARLSAQNTDKTKQTQRTNDAVYRFWDMEVGASATARFLPDRNESNPWFWVERQIIRLPFNGVEGTNDNKTVIVQVPCIEMYGEEYKFKCPILAEVRPWYKDKSLEELANKYWKKRSFIFQGFVRQNPIVGDLTPANPIRRFIINTQILPIIQAGLVDPEVLELPTHYTKGLDFIFRKTPKPGNKYPEYTTSNFSRRESALTEAELEAIQTHGLYNLADFLPKKPSETELKIIKEMFDASVDGKKYDPAKWGAYYRPYGIKVPDGATEGQALSDEGDEAPARAPSVTVRPTAPVVDDSDDDVPFEPNVSTSVQPQTKPSTDKAADILALIRSRQNKG
jgi:hypothetical protein